MQGSILLPTRKLVNKERRKEGRKKVLGENVQIMMIAK